MERPAAARAFAIFVLLAGVLSGCSLFVPKLESPRLSVVNVEWLKSDLWEQRLKVRMLVQNPNDRPFPVKGIAYTLDVDGQELAHGVSGASFVVPAMGEAEFDVSVVANMAGTLINLLGRRDPRGEQMDYRLAGKISLSEGWMRTIAFEQKGTFRLQ
ncbi:MAG TPA: LEA type 2 family protein [Steroidobacteraceae bacterium]|nr:LEA type 2 family protein [Steroidobacteraceae bacterium]